MMAIKMPRPGTPHRTLLLALACQVEDMTPESQHELLRTLRPVVMDQTIREPATNTPFGHMAGYMLFWLFKGVWSHSQFRYCC